MRIRTATMADAKAMSTMLQKLVAAGKRSARANVEFVQQHYIANPAGIRCSLAEDQKGNLLGFQSLIRATGGNSYDTPVGWGIIGTHVSPDAARTGVGTKLFEASWKAAVGAGLTKIEAYTGKENLVA